MMTPDQEALLALFKSDFTPENQGIKLLEKLEKWKYEHWDGAETKRTEENISVEKRQLKIDLFVAWFKDQVVSCDKEMSSGSYGTDADGTSSSDNTRSNNNGTHANLNHIVPHGGGNGTNSMSLIHDDLYLKVVRSRDGGELLNLKDEGTMVGVFSKRPLQKGNPVLKIPSKAMLIASDTLSLIMKVMNHECLAGSSWKPYFDVLPRFFPTLPMYWNLEQISKIKTTSVFEEALQDMIMSYKQYLLISQVVSQRKMDLTSDLCTWPLFKWARGVVLTRQNPIKQVQEGQETVKTMYGLVPLYDFFNHQSGEISAFYDPSLNILEMNAGFDSDADEQVFMSYGNRSNRQLFIYSGFIDKYSTQNDSISIPFSLSKTDLLFKKRSKLMDLMMLPKQGPLSLFNLYHPESEKCIQSLIIMFIDESDLLSCLSQIEKDLSVELNLAGIASKTCMKKVWKWVKVRLQVSIKTNQRGLDAIQRPNEEIVKCQKEVQVMIEELFEHELEVSQAILEQVNINLE